MAIEKAEGIELETGQRQILSLLGERKAVDQIVDATGVPRRMIEGVVKSAKIVLSSNDSAIEDFLDMVEKWTDQPGELFFSEIDRRAADHEIFLISQESDSGKIEQEPIGEKQAIIDKIEADWSPEEMRELGASLLKLADCLEQDWHPDQLQAAFRWPSEAAKIERNALELAKKATLVQRQIKMRERFLPARFLGEPAWNMLLELFCQFAGGAKISAKSLKICASCPDTTATRTIERLEEAGLIDRTDSPFDGRVKLFGLTRSGVVGVGRILERITV